jgi:hypothetical protein
MVKQKVPCKARPSLEPVMKLHPGSYFAGEVSLQSLGVWVK